jgi:hypothetical protein
MRTVARALRCYDNHVLQLKWKAAATVVTGATALAGWLATPAAPARGTARSAGAPRSVPVTVSLEQEAARLAVRNRAATAFERPDRNPFQFSAAPAPARRRVMAEATVTESAVPQAPVFPFRLTGMARDESSGTAVRTAILSSGTALVLARAGDIVAESYRLERVDDDAVDVVDVRDGRVIRLTLGR